MMRGAVRRVLRFGSEAAGVGLVAGAAFGLVRSRAEISHGFTSSSLSAAAADALSGLLWSLIASLVVISGIAAARLAGRGPTHAALFGVVLVAIPSFLWAAYRVNVQWLPEFMELESLAWNAAMTVVSVALILVLVPLVRRRWEAAGRPETRVLWIPWGLAAGLVAVPPLVGARGQDQRPPVFLIVIDALRADHLGSYGYGRATSPHLDRLAREGVRFSEAVSHGTSTKTSIASLLTGLDPHMHGVYVGNKKDTKDRITSDVLPSELETLAEVLLRGRYRTVAWIQQAQLRSFHGFAQGYLAYHEDQGSVKRITESALRWTRKRGAGGPFFVHLHLIDLHDPYRPRPPYDRLYGSYSDVYRGVDFREWGKHRKEISDGRRPLSAADVEQLRALYDGQINFIDQQLGRFFEQLRRSGLYDRSLILVTADHGDGFMEHGFISHSTLPYEELVRIPLVMKLPGGRHAGRVVHGQVRHIDVMPTILEMAALRAPHSTGRSLLPLLEGRPEHPGDAVIEFAEGVALRKSAWKYIRLVDGRRELYDLRRDPGERHNLAAEAPREAARFEVRAAEILARRAALVDRSTPLDASTIERLKALGYVQ